MRVNTPLFTLLVRFFLITFKISSLAFCWRLITKKNEQLFRCVRKKGKVVHVEKLKLRVERFSLKIGTPTTKTHRVKKLDYLIALHALNPSTKSSCSWSRRDVTKWSRTMRTDLYQLVLINRSLTPTGNGPSPTHSPFLHRHGSLFMVLYRVL